MSLFAFWRLPFLLISAPLFSAVEQKSSVFLLPLYQEIKNIFFELRATSFFVLFEKYKCFLKTETCLAQFYYLLICSIFYFPVLIIASLMFVCLTFTWEIKGSLSKTYCLLKLGMITDNNVYTENQQILITGQT